MRTSKDTPHCSDGIRHLIECMVSKPAFPKQAFLIGGYTYQQIYDLARGVRAAFQRYGDQESPVCLCAENRGIVAAVLLASLSGGPPIVLPHAFTKPVLEETRQATGYRLAVVEKDCPLPPKVKAVPVGTSRWEERDGPSPDVLNPDSPWIYLFTGGSTGRPKVWSKSPRNLLSEALYLARTFDVSSKDRILATVPPHHIYGLLYSVLLPLVASARVSVRTPSFPNEIMAAMEADRTSLLVSIPSHYRAMAGHPIERHFLRGAFSSAGALSPEDDDRFFSETGVPITEIYGSTETGGIAARCRAAGAVSLTPFDGVDWKITGDRLRIRSEFLSAELATDAEGYFVPADRVEPVGRNGFQLLGRSDGITKVAGKRVDLRKIGEILKAVNGVREAYVFTMGVATARENEILALVEGKVSAERLRKKASEHLEPHAQPRRIKVVDRIPVSAAGKFDRRKIEMLFL